MPEIEQRADRDAVERRANRRLDCGIGHMQLADTVPLGGMAAEVVLCRGGARSAHGGKPLAIARDNRIVGIEPRDESAGDVGGAAVLAQTKERP